MRAEIIVLVAVALPTTAAAWRAAVGARPRIAATASALRVSRICAAEEETWSFGDADDSDSLSQVTADAIAAEEVELTEKQKEIARLRAAEKSALHWRSARPA